MPRKQEPKDVLVGILKYKLSLKKLRDENWYHIPIETKFKYWPPRMLAFYQGYRFGNDGFRVQCYGEFDHEVIVPRKELFETTKRNEHKAEKLYRKIYLKKLEKRPTPILVYRPRAWAFIHTTQTKFDQAEQLNDLFAGSFLEERLWKALKYENILAEREWRVNILGNNYIIDFAVFCKNGKLAIETDGYTTHYQSRDKIDYDTKRRNAIGYDDWDFLHYTPKHIRENWTSYLTEIKARIEKLGGEESLDEFNRKIGEEQAPYEVEDVEF